MKDAPRARWCHSSTEEKLVSIFAGAVERSGGKIFVSRSESEVVAYLSRLVQSLNVKTAVISDQRIVEGFNISKRLSKLGIKLVRLSADENSELSRDALSEADLGITGADLGIAETGSILLITSNEAERLASSLPMTHVALIRSEDIVESFSYAMMALERLLKARWPSPCVVSFITGPSKTGDVESTHSMGVHGPHDVHVVVLNTRGRREA